MAAVYIRTSHASFSLKRAVSPLFSKNREKKEEEKIG